jgi:hypothetical protein
MKPSVGRIVHYYRRLPSDANNEARTKGPYAAIITKVHEDDTCELNVFFVDGEVAYPPYNYYMKIPQRESGIAANRDDHWWTFPPRV